MKRHKDKPTGTILIPAYEEEAGIADTLHRVAVAVQQLDGYDWDIVVVDDGSSDDTAGQVRQAASRIKVPIRLIQHVTNQGLGGALRTGFANTTGNVVIVLDSDLSYHEDHIARLLEAWEETRAHVVIASPYMEGGHSSGVPKMLERRSKIANRILSTTALGDIKTLTGMVRAYDGPFVRGVSLKAVDVDINTEIIYKTQLLRGTIVEIPGHLDWSGLNHRVTRNTMMSRRARWNTAKTLVLSYLFRPFWFVLAPALIFLLVALVLAAFGQLGWHGLAVVCSVLGVTLAFISLGMLQAKRYFEELYFQGVRFQEEPANVAYAHPGRETHPMPATMPPPESEALHEHPRLSSGGTIGPVA